ncbi:SpoIID/LytB domain-containing protein [Microcoleus sp. FACHB-1515]|uniref:SpoIID/LytB domain-containing protein n=1 Tax=Cyanophyceae TaxID=3028117 RepID=UPI001683A786|nr:SpoIID/LytB domain-containing protein [Microcoleus sp. FACHB-1515]MBD2089370.1 SpoIID/LytB domain-containing protein [Microcoleus sp. FACHB-1515]
MTAAQTAIPSSRWLQTVLRLGKQSWWLTLLLWLVSLTPAKAAELELRVAIEQDASSVVVGSSTPAVVKDAQGQVLARLGASQAVEARSDGNGAILIDNGQQSYRTGQLWVEPSGESGLVSIGTQVSNSKWYRGRTLVVPTADGLTAVNYVDLEEYLYSVVGGEMPTNWSLEALKAQAVAARSYALYQRQSGANSVFDMGDTTRWQFYQGVEEEAPSTIAAVNATAGQVLTYQGQIINAVFHSSSGGHTENSEDVWVQALPYLRAVEDYDTDAPVFQWQETFSADQMSARITGIGTVLEFRPVQMIGDRRVRRMLVVGSAGTREMTGDQIRQALNLRSTYFRIAPNLGSIASTESVPSTPVGFQVVGRGFGHGLGMSQYGAYALARQGNNYQQILAHYYQRTQLSRIQVR